MAPMPFLTHLPGTAEPKYNEDNTNEDNNNEDNVNQQKKTRKTTTKKIKTIKTLQPDMVPMPFLTHLPGTAEAEYNEDNTNEDNNNEDNAKLPKKIRRQRQ